jgi:hypothetical protein
MVQFVFVFIHFHPDPGGQKDSQSGEMVSYEGLDVIPWGIYTSPLAWTSLWRPKDKYFAIFWKEILISSAVNICQFLVI